MEKNLLFVDRDCVIFELVSIMGGTTGMVVAGGNISFLSSKKKNLGGSLLHYSCYCPQ